MNSTQALARLRKLLGPKAGIRDHSKPSSPEQREAAHAKRLDANKRRSECEAAMCARRDDLLAADADYQRLRAEFNAAREAQKKLDPIAYYRYSAGRVSSVGGIGFFSVDAEADTLAELLEKVEAKRVSA